METLPEVAKPKTMARAGVSLLLDVARFEHAQRVAKLLASSTMIPDHFKGNIGNCVIALNLAERFMADPFMVMQNVYIVHGKPGLEGKLIIALVNQCGKFTPLQFKFEKSNGTPVSCTAYAKHKETEEKLEQTVTWKMVEAEGWNEDKKSRTTGKIQKSKWNTMPELMFQYRSATFFARVYCPEVILGMQTIEEILDFVDMSKRPNGTYEASESDKAKVAELKKEMKTEDGLHGPDEVTPPDPAPLSRENWIYLRKAGYPTFVHKYAEEIKNLKFYNHPLYVEMVDKWDDFFDIPWPYHHAPVEAIEATEPVEQDQENGSTDEDELRKAKAQFNYWKQANPKAVAATYSKDLECNAKPMEEWGASDYWESVKEIEKIDGEWKEDANA